MIFEYFEFKWTLYRSYQKDLIEYFGTKYQLEMIANSKGKKNIEILLYYKDNIFLVNLPPLLILNKNIHHRYSRF